MALANTVGERSLLLIYRFISKISQNFSDFLIELNNKTRA